MAHFPFASCPGGTIPAGPDLWGNVPKPREQAAWVLKPWWPGSQVLFWAEHSPCREGWAGEAFVSAEQGGGGRAAIRHYLAKIVTAGSDNDRTHAQPQLGGHILVLQPSSG